MGKFTPNSGTFVLGDRACATGETSPHEVEVLAAGNTIANIDFSIKPITDETNRVVFLIWEAQDISNKKRAGAEIYKLKTQLEKCVAERTLRAIANL
ncbi:hypothetical protein [Chlorogloeopsis sp. ULAP02]|uniref:hypothetical protein n=1 Tax=Chlorogloeopsis sp. ULAP02 TaxID=3107926 RepID=UPI003136A42B